MSTGGLRPIVGDGVLARSGNLVVLCATSDVAPDLVERVLGALARVAAGNGDGSALGDAVGSVLDAESTPPAAVAFGPGGNGVAVAVFGPAWADVSTAHGDQRLALRQRQPGGMRSVLPGGLRSIRAGLGEIDATAAPDEWSRLDAGIVRAKGLLFEPSRAGVGPAPAPVETPKPVPAAELAPIPASEPSPVAPAPQKQEVDRSAPFSAVVLVSAASKPALAAPAAAPRAPLPLATATDAAAPAARPAEDGERPVILGVYCKNGHFDDPEARYCAICGISMAQQTLVPRPGPRPPLGVLVLDDGSIFSLDTDYVIGREPSREPSVAAGRARPLRVEDPSELISRAHALIELDNWRVKVVDLGSANGTGIQLPKEQGWRRLPPKQSVVIVPGTRVGLGRREFRYESHRNTS